MKKCNQEKSAYAKAAIITAIGIISTARDFIQSHPLDFMDAYTKAWLYIAMLANDYIKSSIPAYKKNFFEIVDKHFDMGALKSQYRSLTEVLGTEEPLEKLNLLFKERFLAVPALSTFYRELNNEVLEALTPRDPETSLQIFQLLMNNKFLDQTVSP